MYRFRVSDNFPAISVVVITSALCYFFTNQSREFEESSNFARESNVIDTSRRIKLYRASSYIRKFVHFRRDFRDFAIRVLKGTFKPIPILLALMLSA